MDIKDIIRSWWSARNPTIEESALAKKRLLICQRCPHMVKSTLFNFVCEECGCPIGKKIFSKKPKPCPLDKWN